jgi:hypothetical protein
MGARTGIVGLSVAVLTVLVVSGLGWLQGELDVQVRLQRAESAPAAAPTLAAAVASAVLDPATAALPVPAASIMQARTAPRVPGPGEVAICGDEPIERDRLERLFLGGDAVRPLQPALLDIARELAGGDGLARAVSMMLEAEIRQPGSGADDTRRTAIVESALASADPDLWFLAWRVCGYGEPGASDTCRRVNVQGWAERDVGNGAPWLWLAAQEAKVGNAQGVDEAMYRLSQSRFVDPGWSSLMRLQSHPALAPERGLPALLASVWLMGLQTATALPSYRVLTTYCDAGALAQANRRLRCDDIARVMTTAGRSHVDLMFGHLLGQRVGWDAERLQTLQDLRDAAVLPEIVMGNGRRRIGDTGDLGSCETRRAWVDQAAELSRHGEIEVVRRRIAANGMTLAQAGAKGRAQRAAWAASAPQFASSSPARP